MKAIDKIISQDIEQDRHGAIEVTKTLLAWTKGSRGKAATRKVLKRALKEFRIASDSEYERLRSLIFQEER